MDTLIKVERLVFAGILVLAGTFVAMNAAAAKQIFKTVDEDGNVVFTDVPPRSEERAQRIELVAPNTFITEEAAANEATPGREPWIVEAEEEGEAEAGLVPYAALIISSPGNDENIRVNNGTFSVLAHLDPPLREGHSMRLLLDNVPAGSTGANGTFDLSNVDRGTHTLKAEVLDNNGAVIFAGDPSVFHLQRYSVLTAPKRPGN